MGAVNTQEHGEAREQSRQLRAYTRSFQPQVAPMRKYRPMRFGDTYGSD